MIRCGYCNYEGGDFEDLAEHLTTDTGNCPVIDRVNEIRSKNYPKYVDVNFRCSCGEWVSWVNSKVARHLIKSTPEQVDAHITYQAAGWVPASDDVRTD